MGARNTTAQRCVALLRGINVGGKNRLAMRDLVALCTAAGCTDVATYIQSGNVAFTASADLAARIAGEFAARIARAHKLTVPVIVRTAPELDAVVRRNPFLTPGADEDALHVLFLADAPAPAAIAKLDPNRSPTDQFAVVGREVYLRCPHGIGRTKLTNDYFDAKLGTTSTGRNWRTVLKLVELAKG